MIGLNRIGTSFLLSLSLLVAPSSPAQAQPGAGGGYTCGTASSNAAGNNGTYTGYGTPACNETSQPAQVTVSTTSTVQITVGTKEVSIGVSEASQTSFSQQLQPGECIKIKYTFECSKFLWWFYCESTKTSVVPA